MSRTPKKYTPFVIASVVYIRFDFTSQIALLPFTPANGSDPPLFYSSEYLFNIMQLS